MAKNEKLIADRKAALEQEKKVLEVGDSQVQAPARPQEEIEAEMAALEADEQDGNEERLAAEMAQNKLLAAEKEENASLQAKVKALEKDLVKAKKASPAPAPVNIPAGADASSAEIQQMIADF